MRFSLLPGRRLTYAAGLAVVVVASIGLYVLMLARAVPNVSSLARATPPSSSYMRLRAAADRHTGDDYRIGAETLDDFSPIFICAVVKAEDPYFFSHRGLDWRAIREAAWSTARGQPRGASTITQQLARNMYLRPERTLDRKLREALIAGEIDRELSKRRVLTIYLNAVEWGDGIWGAARASKHYFGKAASELDAFESTFLASILPAPRRPLVSANLDRAWESQQRVLYELYNSGLIDAAEWQLAIRRAVAVHVALDAGASFAAALRVPLAPETTVPPPSSRRNDVPLPHRRALDEGCGLARELGEPGWMVLAPPSAERGRGEIVLRRGEP